MNEAQLPDHVIAHLANRLHRLHHHCWHETRDGWTTFTAAQKTSIRGLGWEPPRASQDTRNGIGTGRPAITNHSGEDFLFMHRQMIQGVRAMISELTGNWLDGWTTIPGPATPRLEDVVPDTWTVPDDGDNARAHNVSMPVIKS